MENEKQHLKELKELGMALRKAQHAYFSQVKANKTNKAAWIDPHELLTASKAAEKAFDCKILELIEIEKKAAQPELFGRR
jgi:hypothetical protein